MARIQQYSTDTTITGGDKLVGNDAADNSTKLFQISDIGERVEIHSSTSWAKGIISNVKFYKKLSSYEYHELVCLIFVNL